jgi:hypothetical protein
MWIIMPANESPATCQRKRGPSRLRQRDVRRLVQAAQSAGLAVQAVEWTAEGGLRVLAGTQSQPTFEAVNSWDSI